MNHKGGVGKTTTAIALATAATRAGRTDVRVYDADEQASASNWAYYAEKADDPLPFKVVEGGNMVRLRRMAEQENGILVIDCPPARSQVTDLARDLADLVIVPTTPKPADMEMTREVVADLDRRQLFYGVLLNMVESRTVAAREAVALLDAMHASYFVAQVPKRQDLSRFFGQSLGTDLFGFDCVWSEICEMAPDLLGDPRRQAVTGEVV